MDAEAIVRILNSPRVPRSVKHSLGTALDNYMDDYRDTSVDIVAATGRECCVISGAFSPVKSR